MWKRVVRFHALDYPKPREPKYSLATASMLANLVEHRGRDNLDVGARTWAVNDLAFDEEHVIDDIMKTSPSHTVGFGVFVWNEKSVTRICKELVERRGFKGKIILGGPQISYTPKGELEKLYPHADVFIRGHGEAAVQHLLISDEETPTYRGVHWAGNTDLGLSTSVDLDSLASPFLTGILPPTEFMRWETQRGCPFTCSFCQHRSLEPQKRRHLNESRVAQEVQWIVENKETIHDIAVVDATFNSGPLYLHTLRNLAEGGFKGKLALQTRAEMITDEFLDAVEILNRNPGADPVLECGLQSIHREEQKYIDRPTNLSKFVRNIGKAKARGIHVNISLIFGLPAQTFASLQQTIKFCEELGVDVIEPFPLMLTRGTTLEKRRDELGLVVSDEIVNMHIDRVQHSNIEHVVSSPSFTYEEWKDMAQYAGEVSERSRLIKRKRDHDATLRRKQNKAVVSSLSG